MPDPGDIATFRRSTLDWSEPGRDPHRAMLAWHRRLIALRRCLPQLTDGRLDHVSTRFDEAEGWLVIERSRVTIAVNFADGPRTLPLCPGRPTTMLLATHDSGIDVGTEQITLPPNALAILGPEQPSIMNHFQSVY